MARLNISLTGSKITDEIINRANSTSSKLAHDTIRFVALDFEIWTGAAKTGTKLVITTDYVLGGQDTDYSAEAGVPVYTTVAIVNGAQQNKNLYVTYKTCGDYAGVENVVEVAKGAIKSGNLSSVTGTATTANATNNILLTGIGLMGLEVGDVIQMSGFATAKNNSEFTVESLIDADNIIVNYEHKSRFASLGQTARNWIGMTTRGSDVYASTFGGDIYKQTGGIGAFVSLGQTARNWMGLTTLGSDVYASVSGGDIYKQTGGTGSFVALGQTSRNWSSMTSNGTDVYASASGVDIYKQTGGTGSFVAIGAGSRNWFSMTTRGSDVYAGEYGGDIYKQTGGTGSFVAIGAGSRNWRGLTILGSDVYASVSGGDIYKQTGGTGSFVALGQTSRNWRNMTTLGSDVYASEYGGDIYKQTVSVTTKALTSETANAGVTVKLLTKWFNAPIGLGHGLVETQKSKDTIYTNSTGRSIEVILRGSQSGEEALAFYVDGVHVGAFQQTNIAGVHTMSFIVPAKSTYYVTGNNGLLAWNELR